MKTVDIYIGENLNIWYDGELAFIDIMPNGLTFMLPLEHLTDLLSEFAQAQANYQTQEISKN